MAEVDAEKLAYEIEWEQHMEELREANRAAERELIRRAEERQEKAEQRHAALLEQQAKIQQLQVDAQKAQAKWAKHLVIATVVLCVVTALSVAGVLLSALMVH